MFQTIDNTPFINLDHISPHDHLINVTILSLAEVMVMYLLDRYVTPKEVPDHKRTQFVRDILCIPLSFILW